MMVDWTRDYFERGYAERWGLRAPDDRVRAEAAGIWDLLELTPGARVADVGCGHGRHALAIAERGAVVIGIDASRALLSRARQLAGDLGVTAQWIRADMRSSPFRRGAFDAALLMDAFGFFATPAEDLAALKEIATSLEPNGRLLLKIVNGEVVLNDLRSVDREEREGQTVEITRTLSNRTMIERIRTRGPRGSGEYRREQRLYRFSELQELLSMSGLTMRSVSEGPDGSPFAPATSERMWIVSVRTAGTLRS